MRTEPRLPDRVLISAIALVAVGGAAKPVKVNGPRSAAVCASDATIWEAGITTSRNSGAKRARTSASLSRAAPPLSWSSVQRNWRPTAVAGIFTAAAGGRV
jgi:hypothetical protein